MKYRLSVALWALAFFTSPALTQTAPTGASVYDGNNAFVGTIFDTNTIWVKFADGEASLQVDEAGGFLSGTAYFYYQSSDCTGPAYMVASELPAKGVFATAPSARANVVSRGVIYYPRPPYVVMSAMSASLHPSPDASNCRPTPITDMVGGRPGVVRLEGYKLPLTVR